MMLTKLRTLISLYRELVFRWSAFRIAYAYRLRMGLIRLEMPQYNWEDYPLETWLKKDIPSIPQEYTQWRKNNLHEFFFDKATYPENTSWNKQSALDEADRILSGEIKYFAHQFHRAGFPPKWHEIPNSLLEAASLPPRTAAGAALNKHWSQISDDVNADIKFIWEPNRFSFVYTLVRAYAASRNEKYAKAFWKLIGDWAEHNPPNTGANWKDGQEIALRLMAWIFGYYAFFDSASTRPQRIAQFTTLVAAQAERIYKNIDYAISTRSNHTISEAAGLWLVGLLFPELKDAEKYLLLGKKLLEKEGEKQIFPDGGYSMYSLNYHRFILHIYFYVMRLGEINHLPFSKELQNSIAQSIQYLFHLIDPQTGQMPVYGSNDGALILPLSNCDFTDYRPLLQLGSFITKGERLFEPGEWDEDTFWLCGESFTAKPTKDAKEKLNLGDLRVLGGESFPDGGVYLLHNTNSRAIIRCTDFRSRPSHADQLHVDLWIHGHNIACDAGTYLYSGEGIWRNGLAHTSVHNTVTVDGKDQMTMLSRFTWTNWSKGRVLQHNEKIWQGEHNGYKPITHKRSIMSLDDNRWVIVDHLIANEPHQYALHWLLNDFPYEKKDNPVLLTLNGMKYKVQVGLAEGTGNFSLVSADTNSTRGWRSRYYGHREPAISIMLEANQPQVIFWSFFGVEDDVVEVHRKSLKVNSKVIPLVK